jgi:hypothetical protein
MVIWMTFITSIALYGWGIRIYVDIWVCACVMRMYACVYVYGQQANRCTFYACTCIIYTSFFFNTFSRLFSVVVHSFICVFLLQCSLTQAIVVLLVSHSPFHTTATYSYTFQFGLCWLLPVVNYHCSDYFCPIPTHSSVIHCAPFLDLSTCSYFVHIDRSVSVQPLPLWMCLKSRPSGLSLCRLGNDHWLRCYDYCGEEGTSIQLGVTGKGGMTKGCYCL